MIRRLDLITTAIILLITVLYTFTALQFPGNAKIVPATFGGLAIILIVIQLISPRIPAFRALSGEFKVEDDRDLDVFRDSSARRRLMLIGASLLAVPLLIAAVGLPITLPLYVAGMLIIQRQRVHVVLACTALIMAMSYGLLVRLLAWPWSDGLLWSFLA